MMAMDIISGSTWLHWGYRGVSEYLYYKGVEGQRLSSNKYCLFVEIDQFKCEKYGGGGGTGVGRTFKKHYTNEQNIYIYI